MKFLKVLISMILVATMCVTMMMPASAGRVTYYLSDLYMAEANTEEEAKNLLTSNGYAIFDKNLNQGGSKAVYLGYKKSTNVEDAITDIRVMNMNGGFNISDYESIVEDALQEYKEEVNNLRIAAKEFAENYKAGKREAQLAYRQLNYYYVEIDKKQVNMGDYMLDFPATNEGFADILLKGNTHILDNIRILLSMGVADGGDLIERIRTAAADESVYGKKQYFEDAKEMAIKIQQLKKMLDDAYAEIDEINADPDMTEEEKEDALIFPQYIASLLVGFDHVLKSIPYGDSDYSEYFETTTDIDYAVLYPFVKAMTEGQRAMAVSGQLNAVLVYNAVEMSDEELNEKLAETEKDLEPLSVYLGTDMNLINGSLGVTSDAIREEAATGNSWFACFTGNQAADIAISSLFGAGGATLASVSLHFLKKAIDATKLTPHEEYLIGAHEGAIAYNKDMLKHLSGEQAKIYTDKTNECLAKIDKINASHKLSTSAVVFSSLGIAVGLTMIGLSIYSIVQIIDKYNPKYTAIPWNMIDTVETSNGNRYIKYNVVKTISSDGKVTRYTTGDTNAHEGDQWNAIYYTKSYEAGKCITATGYFMDSADNFGKYTPVAKFGAKNCYDLNSFNENENAEKVFMAFGNSNNKKAAETSVPTVIGSTFAYGAVAISGVAGMGLGMCIMSLIKRKKED